MSIPDEVYAITDNADGSFTLAIGGESNFIQKSNVSNVAVRNESVLIVETSGKIWNIWDWANETNLGAVSAADLRDKIWDIVKPGPATVSFTYTGPTAINDNSFNCYIIPVSGLSGIYTTGKLISVEFNISFPDWEDCGCVIESPSGEGGDFNNYFWSISLAGQGFNISGADMTNTIIYNSSVQLYPKIETSSAPYTGTWNDFDFADTINYFDDILMGSTLNGDWKIWIYAGSNFGTVNSIIMTFAV